MYKVLLADDEKMELAALSDIVSRAYGEKVQIYEANKGTSAVSTALEQQVDIIIMDVKMPGMNGLEAAKEILSKLPLCKIIIHTGYTYFSYAKECVRLGAVGLLVKPCMSEEIIAEVDHAMQEVDKARQTQSSRHEETEKLRRLRSYAKREMVGAIVYSASDDAVIETYLDMLELHFTRAVAGMIFYSDSNEARKNGVFEQIKSCLSEESRALCCYYERHARLYYLVLETDPAFDISEAVRNAEAFCEGEESFIASHSQTLFRLSDLFGAFSSLRVLKTRGESREPALSSMERFRMEEQMSADLRERKYLEALRRLEVLMENIPDTARDMRQRFLGLMVLLQRSVFDQAELPDAYARYPRLEDCGRAYECRKVVLDYAQEVIGILTEQQGGGEPDWIARTRSFIEENYQQNLSLDEVAHRVSFSPFYFSKLFKKAFGLSFIEYLTHLRIERAKSLLAQGMSVREVSDIVGFTEPNYFTRVFKKETGLTPSNYQKNANSAKIC